MHILYIYLLLGVSPHPPLPLATMSTAQSCEHAVAGYGKLKVFARAKAQSVVPVLSPLKAMSKHNNSAAVSPSPTGLAPPYNSNHNRSSSRPSTRTLRPELRRSDSTDSTRTLIYEAPTCPLLKCITSYLSLDLGAGKPAEPEADLTEAKPDRGRTRMRPPKQPRSLGSLERRPELAWAT